MQEATRLNRLLRLYPPGTQGCERWELGAGPCHVEILITQMVLGDEESEAVSAPGVRMTDEDDGKELDSESRACYRSWTTRASYFSQDGYELLFAVK